MTTWKKLLWVLYLTAAGMLPAYANNPPQPDGLLSILLIFPIVIVGLRLAGVHLRHAGRGWTVVKVVILAVSAVLSAAGDGIGLLGLLVVFCYGFLRGIQVIRKGSGGRRFLVGSVVILWVLFAVSDYYASLVEWPHVAASESGAVAGLRTLDNAENTFKSTLGTRGKLVGVFGTLDELYRAKLIDDSFLGGRDRRGYRYFEILSPTKEQFVFCAVPVQYPAVPLKSLVPGGSLLSALHLRESPRTTAVRAFAVDDTGIIRYSPDGSSAPATREEIERWKELE